MVDYNRAWPQGINYYPNSQTEIHTALDDVAFLSAYHYYHSMLDYFLSRAAQNFGIERVLLIDIHGFKNQPPYAPAGGYDMILGTANKKNIPHGDVDDRLARCMTSLGYSVFLPEVAAVDAKEDCFVANYITQHHSTRHRINAIQIEIASRFRLPENREIRKKLSGDIAEFVRVNSVI
jgi:N-formylglutamate amidohydrolase